eukprot:2447842-Rhodomonas_salina.1
MREEEALCGPETLDGALACDVGRWAQCTCCECRRLFGACMMAVGGRENLRRGWERRLRWSYTSGCALWLS